MKLIATFMGLAKQTFFNMSIALILFCLPIDLLYRLSSWTLFMPPLDIAKEAAMMILLLAFVAVCLALLVAGIGCALTGLMFGRKTGKIEETLSALVAMGSVAIMAIYLLRMLKIWLQSATGITVSVGAAKPVILLFFIVIFTVLVWKYGLLASANAVKPRLAKGSKGVLILIAVAGAVVGANSVSLHDYHEVKNNPLLSPQTGMPNVILLSIDALTSEDMSLYGYRLPTTPRLEAFAKESYVFDNAFSSSNWTTPSVASFISGQYPITSGVHNFYSYFLADDRRKNLGAMLQNNGYRTAAIIANANAHPLLLKISDSFSAATEPPVRKSSVSDIIFYEILRLKDYRTVCWLVDLLKNALESLQVSYGDDNTQVPPELAFDRAAPFLAASSQPGFTWIHILPPHSPYLPSAPFKYTFGKFREFSTLKEVAGHDGEYLPGQQADIDKLRLRYDEFILDTDSRVGNFLDKLKATGRFEDSIIIISADHGESFTKNYKGHAGPYLYQPVTHIPLIIHLPGQKHGKRIPWYVGQVDLLPTVIDLLNLPLPDWAEGESLKSVMLEGKPTTLPKFSMNLDAASRFVPPKEGTFAVMKDGWKLVRYLGSGKEELYYLATDSQENHDLAGSNPEKSKEMRELIYGHFNLGK